MKSGMNDILVYVWGEHALRFIQLLKKKNIPLYELTSKNEGYVFFISPVLLMQNKELCRKCHVKVKILSKNKWCIYKRMRKTVFAFFFFLLLSVFFFYWSNTHVLSLSINEERFPVKILSEKIFLTNESETNESGTNELGSENENIYRLVKEYGVHMFMKKDDVKIRKICTQLKNDLPDCQFATVYFDGSTLCVQVENSKEFETVKEVGFQEKPVHLISDKNGVIDSMIVRSGTPKVKIGDSIEAGTQLVSGIVAYLDNEGVEQNCYVKADATITIAYEKTITIFRKNNEMENENLEESLENALEKFIVSLEEKGVTIKQKNVTIETNEEGKTLNCTFLLQESVGILQDGNLSDVN